MQRNLASSELKAGGGLNDGLIHTIAEADVPVNSQGKRQTETKQFRRWFGNSVVVSEDGSPKVVYRQTAGEIEARDTSARAAMGTPARAE